MAVLLKSLADFCQKTGLDKTYYVAFSGGLDSTVLLHLLKKFREKMPLQLRAIHINHQLSPKAQAWAKQTEEIASNWQIPFILKEITLPLQKDSVENLARRLRYEALSACLSAGEVLLTAHHQDDQAETLLLQLFRGAGPKGLAGISPQKMLGKNLLARPLLNFSRQVLQEYAQENQLTWIEDESNQNTQFTRNFIRHEIMPKLTIRWPSITKQLARSAKHCLDMQGMIEKYCQQHMTDNLSIKKLLTMDQYTQNLVIREWLSQQTIPLPSTKKLKHIVSDLLHSRSDKTPIITWDNFILRRYRDQLVLQCKSVLPSIKAAAKTKWTFTQKLSFGNFHLIAKPVHGEGLSQKYQSAEISFRTGGEKIKLPGRKHHHHLKKLFQTWQIPYWERDKVPLIYLNNELAVVVGYAVAEKFQAQEDELGWQIEKIPTKNPANKKSPGLVIV